ncbi:SMP-30/gluconolactonase/LRE family protein [Plantibacter sp. RU18]|uniref:SMP-30/gluconolactonase/LRE family protein n=1 Tax=Plantibacter sp. RU18 TaxID=3158143 RepID=UPI003D359F99
MTDAAVTRTERSPLLAEGAVLEHLFTGTAWAEGPAWIAETGRVRWSDIPNDRILEFDEASGETTAFRDGAEYTNGRTIDREGRVVQCSHGRRAVEIEGADGPVTLVDRWAGGRFNSPNDVVVRSDGSIWFTDPPYGIDASGREGHPGEPEYDGCFVFRFDPATGDISPVINGLVHPNGLAFSPDESLLYVSDTGGEAGEDALRIAVYDVDGDAVRGGDTLGRTFARPAVPASDGFRVDVLGRVWSSAGDGVEVFDADGASLLRITVPERTANVCFGGVDGGTLYITASSSLYRIRTATREAPRPVASA